MCLALFQDSLRQQITNLKFQKITKIRWDNLDSRVTIH